jgi:signal transduction histidine kinase
MTTTADAPQVKLEDLQELARMILCLQGDERAELANELAQAIGRFVRAGNI